MTLFYVDPQRSGNGVGSFNDPFKSHADVKLLLPGDVVLQKSGSVSVGTTTVDHCGSKTNHIIYGAYEAVTGARITDGIGKAMINAAGARSALTVNPSVSYVTIDGLEGYGSAGDYSATFTKLPGAGSNVIFKHISAHSTDGAGSKGVRLEGNDCKLLNSEVFGIGNDGISAQGDNLEIGFCSVRDVSLLDIYGDCIQIHSSEMPARNWWVHDNVLDHSSVDCKAPFTHTASRFPVLGGTFESNKCYCHPNSFSAKGFYSNVGRLVIRNNIFTNGSWAIAAEGSDWTIYKNQIIQRNDGFGIVLNNSPRSSVFENTLVNLFSGAKTSTGIEQWQSGPMSEGISIEDNTVVGYKMWAYSHPTSSASISKNMVF